MFNRTTAEISDISPESILKLASKDDYHEVQHTLASGG